MSQGRAACVLPSPMLRPCQTSPPPLNLRGGISAPRPPPIAWHGRDLRGLGGATPRLLSAGGCAGKDAGGSEILAGRGTFLRGGGARGGASPPRSLGARGSGGVQGGMRGRRRRWSRRKGDGEEDEGDAGGEEGGEDSDSLCGVYMRRGRGGVKEGGASGWEVKRAQGERGGGEAGRSGDRERRSGGEGLRKWQRSNSNGKGGLRRAVGRRDEREEKGEEGERRGKERRGKEGEEYETPGEEVEGFKGKLKRVVREGSDELVSAVKGVKESVEDTITGTVADVTETVKETVKEVTETVAQVGEAVMEQAREVGGGGGGVVAVNGEKEEEEDMSPMRMLLGVSDESGRKAQSQLGVIQHRPSIVSLLYNLYSHMLKQPPLRFALAVCSAPVLLSLLFTLLYLPDLDGLVVEDTLLAYLQTSVAASASRGLEDESFFTAPAMAAGSAGAAARAAGAAAPALRALSATGPAAAAAAASASAAVAASAAAAAQEAASGGLFNVVDGSQTLGDAVRALEESGVFKGGVLSVGVIPGGCAWGIFQVLMFSLSLSTGLEPSLAPASPYALVVANVNALVAQLLFVFLSGAVFARLTQPVDPILCSKVACITPPMQNPAAGASVPSHSPPAARSLTRSISSANFSGTTAFAAVTGFAAAGGGAGGAGQEAGGMIGGGGAGRDGSRGCPRMLLVRYVLAGPQPCELVDVKVELTLKHNTLSCTGRFFRQVDHLKLVRSEDSYQRYGMTVRHVIDESSPLHDRSREDLCLVNAQLSLAVIGMERASMQPVFHVEDYFVVDEEVIWNADFQDMVYRDANKGRLLVDHRRISNWVAVEL